MKNAGRAFPWLLILISVGCFFATYNFLTMHGRGRDGPRKLLNGGVSYGSRSGCVVSGLTIMWTSCPRLASAWQVSIDWIPFARSSGNRMSARYRMRTGFTAPVPPGGHDSRIRG